ncbi:phospholipase [Fulvivirga sp. RKSG066]|uniref:carboxylesterase family protein n=1 Tax=Fulvivirga aurantia TaxID=2529383 RepID=UPI0012BC15A6|nr:prolyl oligopeptidase family serine peptidase [Fulvivirga aurantia]MTI21714.1 phospholipase [Fulvivirga aurantia]
MNKFLTALLIFVSMAGFAQNKFEKGSHKGLPFRVLFPENFNQDEKYPVILFLHGAGERGSDNEKQLVHGSDLFINQKISPAIVIAPQCPQDDYWAKVDVKRSLEGKRIFSFPAESTPTDAMQSVMHLVDSVRQLGFVDKSRLYVGGLSMGGMGTFEILSRRPEVFAAAFPICGGGNPQNVTTYADEVDLWVFHGAKDDIVPPALSEQMVDAIKKAGGDVKFTLYPEANHNSWDSAFAEPELLTWLFSKSK